VSRRWLPILVAVDAFLVAAVLVTVLLVVHPSGPIAQAPGGTATAGQTGASAPSASPGVPQFQLPSGNIACDMTTDNVTCTIADKTFTAPPDAGCSGDAGHTIVLTANGVAVPCVQGPRPTAAATAVPTLNYGGTTTVGQYTCTSATNGVTCVNGMGKGFRLARQSLVMLP
jgi:hypothetical protein